jgi:hypothetical protein
MLAQPFLLMKPSFGRSQIKIKRGAVMNTKHQIDQPAYYHIRVLGRMGSSWAEYFEPLTIDFETGAQGVIYTLLAGTIIDQAALQGILHNLYQLGFPLISIEKRESDG